MTTTHRNTPLAEIVPPRRKRSRGALVAGLLLLAVLVASWITVAWETTQGDTAIFSAETWEHFTRFIQRLLGFDKEVPAFADPEAWWEALVLAYETLAMSVLAIGISTAGMLLTVMLAARPKGDDSFALGRHPLGLPIFLAMRAAYIVSRAVPELFWAMLVVLVFSPGVFAAALALALHNFGVLSKLCAEVVEDIDPKPIRSLRASGANGWQALLYGVLPAVLPHFLTYVLYRWEIIIRATIIIGFVSASGLGHEFQLSMSFLRYDSVFLLLIIYFLLVIMVDLLSSGARRLAR